MKENWEVRFWRFVQKSESCWLWTGYVDEYGYGRITIDGVGRQAHKLSLEMKLGRRLRDGMESDHLCRVRACVRPDHLEEVTGLVNQQRGNAPTSVRKREIAITGECPHGHVGEYKIEADGLQHCGGCNRDRQRARRAKKKERENVNRYKRD